MKIICSVKVVNRMLPSFNLIGSNKAVRSSLIIGKHNEDIFIKHQTNQNGCGKKYSVKDNIANVFVKFINEGKATIRFKEPQHDIAIECDPIQLKSFMKTLKTVLDGQPSCQISTVDPNSTTKAALKPIKKNLKISSKEEYPILEGFPRTLESLTINNSNQKTLDSRILRLRCLQVLNLEDNVLLTLPNQLGSSLPCLVELYLTNNNLGPGKDWRWIVNSKLQKQLKLLDIRGNEIDVLPDKIIRLENLVTLKLEYNNLQELPKGIGLMKNLRYLSVSNNKIHYLPGSIFLLKLESIDVSKNAFYTNNSPVTESDFKVSSLLDIAASTVVYKKLQYSEWTLPQTLIDYLDNPQFCDCGKPCFQSTPVSIMRYQDSRHSPTTIITSAQHICSVAILFCSYFCYLCADRRRIVNDFVLR